jgi:deoxycytidine triphosphate deaminase
MLNANELVARGIITGPITEDNIAQHGIDLNVIKIFRIAEYEGFIPTKGKTVLPIYEEVSFQDGTSVWRLEPGMYDVVFAQGCDIPSDQMLLIRQRSSLLRCGAFICSNVYDAGFKTDNLGTMLTVIYPISIEFNARIAQIYNHQATPVENLYDGQWQHDSQRVQ